MQRLSYPTETVLSNKIARNRIVLSFKDRPKKPLGRRPIHYLWGSPSLTWGRSWGRCSTGWLPGWGWRDSSIFANCRFIWLENWFKFRPKSGFWIDSWFKQSWIGPTLSLEGAELRVEPEREEHHEEEDGPEVAAGELVHRLSEQDESQAGAARRLE